MRDGEAEGDGRSPPDRQQFQGGQRAAVRTILKQQGMGEPGVPASLGRRRPAVQIHLP